VSRIKAVILAGGRGTRLAEETGLRPKPMVEIGGRPILWHIMKIYSHHGINDFIVCAGYKAYIIKEYFANFAMHNSDVMVDLAEHTVTFSRNQAPPWRVHVIDTGEDTMTGGRLARIRHLVDDDPFFCMTYGDGLAVVDVGASINFHRRHGLQATMTVVRPSARFGNAILDGSQVTLFQEKPQTELGFINGGFFVLSPQTLSLVDDDQTMWEHGPLQRLVERGQLGAWQHQGFWQPMDTLREKEMLETLWSSGKASWMVWS
jgi:glucose-1-phosphate cytidylyltransferase